MALVTTCSASSPSHRLKIFNSSSFQPSIFTSRFHFRRHSRPPRRLLSNSNKHPPRSLSSGPGPPSSPDSDTSRPSGLAGKVSRLKDRVQIILAVLFWMSLFFWASAWDGRNSGRGRPNKGSRFRR